MMHKWLSVALALSLLAACGDEEEPLKIDDSFEVPDVSGAPTLEDENPETDALEVSLRAQETTVSLDDETDVEMYTYNGEFPGPMIQARVGQKVVVEFQNDLPEPTTIHWHGLRIDDEMDGSPRVQDPIEPGESFTYEFEVPEAGSFWYHPHVRGNEQVEKGLYGLLVVHRRNEPEFDQQRYLTVDDILLDENDEFPTFLGSHPEQMHGRYGNRLLTGGSLDPVEREAQQGDVERWRLVNTANARTMKLHLEGASWRVVGTDGGPLSEPKEFDELTMSSGRRYDIEVTYDDAEDVTLYSRIPVRNDAGDVVEEDFPIAEIDVEATDRTPREIDWPEAPSIPDREVDREEQIELDARQGPGGIEWLINGEADRAEPLFTFQEGETVRFTIQNNAGPEHPFHLHGQFFRVVDPAEPGLRDTVLVPGMDSVEIIAYMDNPGQWMTHCHILEHAELGMMTDIVVEPTDDSK